MFDKKESYHIKLPEPIICPDDNCQIKSNGKSKLVPLFIREGTFSDKMVIIWKCTNCSKEIK